MKKNLFLDPAQSGVFHLPVQGRGTVEANAGAARLNVVAAYLGDAKDKESVLGGLGRTLRFPDWYGANLDALYDCLTDPDWHPASGQVLLISGLNGLQSADPDGYSLLIEVFRSATEACRDTESPLWILLDTPADDLPTLPAQ